MSTFLQSIKSLIARALRWGMLLAVVYGVFTLGQIWRAAQQDEAAPADAIVVLGTAQWAGRPSPVLRARLDHAIQLYEQGYAPLLITTGGYGRDPRYSEGGVSAAYAMQRGVPATAILTEEVGTSTWESMQQVQRLAEANGIARVIVVSDPFHIARTERMAREVGLEPLGSPTRTSPISRRPFAEMNYFLREVISLTFYRLVWTTSA